MAAVPRSTSPCADIQTFRPSVFRASLTQHLLAVAAHLLLLRNPCLHSGHLGALYWLRPRLCFRCIDRKAGIVHVGAVAIGKLFNPFRVECPAKLWYL